MPASGSRSMRAASWGSARLPLRPRIRPARSARTRRSFLKPSRPMRMSSMVSFEWQRKPSKNFGEVWVPVAVVQLQTSQGRFRSFQGYLDSGSVASLLRRSAADELGLRIEAGRRIFLSNVGGSQTEAFVHELRIRFSADDPPILASFSFCSSETVPNLIGALGV